MQQLPDFISANTGKRVGDTPENLGQCVGLIEVWLDNLGLNNPHLYGNAIDLLNNADKSKFNVVYNTPTGIPPVGAVMTFGSPYGKAVVNGKTVYYGHTGIVVKATVNNFTLFEQNNPTGTLCKQSNYSNYNSVMGWFYPKVAQVTGSIDKSVLKAIVDGSGSDGDKLIAIRKLINGN